MMGAILAQHAPLIRDYPGAPPTPPAPPAPPTPIEPPQAEPIAFSAVTRPSLFGIIGSAISSTTLATITCADASMTITQSEVVAGLTFSYSAGVLTIAGTPTGSTRVQRVVVSYIASDGSNTVRGSTSHEITLVSASEVLTIGTVSGVSGQVGKPLDALLCEPTANFDADIQVFGATAIRGLTTSWAWDRALGTGELRLVGTPKETFGPSGAYSFGFQANGQSLGSAVAPCTIVPSYSAPAPAPAPTPAPPPPAPSPPPVPAPAPAPGLGPDAFASSVKVLLHFDSLDAPFAYAPESTVVRASGTNSATGQNSFIAPYCTQEANPGLGYMQRFGYSGSAFSLSAARLSHMSAVIPGVDGFSDDVSVECLVRPAQVLWDALYASGNSTRYSPLVTCRRASDGAVIWSLGLRSGLNSLGRFCDVTFLVPLGALSAGTFASATTVEAISQPLGYGSALSYVGRFFHAAGACGARTATLVRLGAWNAWQAGSFSQSVDLAAIKADANCIVQIGGDVGNIDYVAWWTKDTTIIPFTGDLDEVRVTIGRYSALIGLANVSDIAADKQVIPFSNP